MILRLREWSLQRQVCERDTAEQNFDFFQIQFSLANGFLLATAEYFDGNHIWYDGYADSSC